MNFLKNKKDKKFYSTIDEILYYHWDPLGVNTEPEARSEYSSYSAKMYSILISNDDKKNIIKYFDDVESQLGVSSSKDKKEKITDILFSWKNYIYKK